MGINDFLINVQAEVYSFAGDEKATAFPFQHVLCPSEVWGSLGGKSILLHISLPPIFNLLNIGGKQSIGRINRQVCILVLGCTLAQKHMIKLNSNTVITQ